MSGVLTPELESSSAMAGVTVTDPGAVAADSDQLLSVGNVLTYVKKRAVDILGLFSVSAVLIFLLDHQAFRAEPLSYSDLTVPYLYGSLGLNLSSSSPWYILLVSSSFSVLHYNLGFLVNGVDVLSYALAPIGMYLLLDQFRLSRTARIGGSLFFLFNPFTLDLAAGYLQYSTFWFAAPIVIALLIRYDRSNRFPDLIAASLVTFVLFQLNPLAGIRLIAPIALGFWILPFLTRRRKDFFGIAKDIGIALAILFGLSLAGVLLSGSLNNVSYWFSSGSSASSSLYQFTLSQIQFTYQGQNFLNSLALLTVYPGSNMEIIGYPGTWFYVVWIISLSACLAAGAAQASYRQSRYSAYYLILLCTLVCLIGFEVGVWSGVLIPLFNSLPFLLEYEYPDVLHLIEIVVYAVLFGAFVNALPRVLSAIGRPFQTALMGRIQIREGSRYPLSILSGGTKYGAVRAQKSGYRIGLGVVAPLVVGLLIVIPSAPIVNPSQAQGINPTFDASNYLPPYFGQIGNYLHSSVGDSRVLPLPLNYSTIIEFYSAVPQGRIFGIPYAGVNNPSAYPSAERVFTVLHAVVNQNSSELAYLLEINNIQYVVIFNPESVAPLSLVSNPYDPYLNGGGGNFLSTFLRASNFSLMLSTTNFAILRDDLYTAPVIEPVSAYLSRPLSEGSVGEPISTEILQDQNLTSRDGWGQWTSCNGSQSTYISYSDTGSRLSACQLNQTFTGVRSQTEIYQWANLTPFENLSIRVQLAMTGNVTVNLIVIFHNASNANWSRVFYTSNQSFPAVIPNSAGYFQFNVTSPSDSVGGIFGIQDFGPARGPGGAALIESIDMWKTFSYLTNYSPESYPFEPTSTLVLPLTAQSDALSPFTGQIASSPPSSAIPQSEASSVSDDITDGAVYFPAGNWVLDLPCEVGSAPESILLGHQVNATGTLTASNGHQYPVISGWSTVPAVCINGAAILTLRVSGIGSLGIEEWLEITSPAPVTPRLSITIASALEGEIHVSSAHEGIALLMSAEGAGLHTFQNSSLAAVVQYGGLTVWAVSFGNQSSLTVSLSGFAVLNYAEVGYNIALVILALVAVIMICLSPIRHRLKRIVTSR